MVDCLPPNLQEELDVIPENAKRLSGNHFATILDSKGPKTSLPPLARG
jgi:hypothetical protein